MEEIANKAKSKRGNPSWKRGGASPNPSGRPKDVFEIRLLARKYSGEAIAKLVEIMRAEDVTNALRAASSILDRGCGRVASQEQVEREDNEIPAEIRALSDAELARIVAKRIEETT